MNLIGRITIKVKPNSGESKIVSFENNILHVELKAKPENNKANIELMKLLKRETGKNIRLVAGLTSKNKVVVIE